MAPGRWRTLAVLIAMVVTAAAGILPILHAALAAAMLMIVLRVLTPDEARQALDLDVLFEHQGGHILPQYTGYQNARRGVWFPCYAVQEKIIAESKRETAEAG